MLRPYVLFSYQRLFINRYLIFDVFQDLVANPLNVIEFIHGFERPVRLAVLDDGLSLGLAYAGQGGQFLGCCRIDVYLGKCCGRKEKQKEQN